MAARADDERLYLGFDLSTQQLKVIAVSDTLEVVYEGHVQFDADLPEFNTQGGVHIHPDHVTITTPTRMWVKALELLLDRMKAEQFPFHRVRALSGAGQQHGSVYWKQGAQTVLTNLQADQTLYDQLKDCFSVEDSPIWMDSSTTAQCRQLEEKVGGAQALADITGSRAYERFTGSQIMRIFQTQRQAYDNTERISLVSSFAASLFIGDYAPIDHSDGTGMNLLDIWTRQWSPQCLEACGTDLHSKLGPVVHSTEKVVVNSDECMVKTTLTDWARMFQKGCEFMTDLPLPGQAHIVATEGVKPISKIDAAVEGQISSYLVSRYGFNPECIVSAFVGDNPASFAGLSPDKGDIIVSLGTSDTVFLWLTKPTPGLSGHIFANPLNRDDFISLTCFKNGSLTRERIRDEKAEGSWEVFSELLKKTPPGNNGNFGVYFDVKEIQPFADGVYRYNEQDEEVDSFPPEVEVRAVLEGQFIARRVHSEMVGFQFGRGTKVIATGGGSKNVDILQVLSDVFNSPVYVKDVPNSACFGCAVRAKHTLLGPSVPFSEVVKSLDLPVLVATPRDSGEVYTKLCQRYREFENRLEGS